MIKLVFLGTSDATPSIRRNHTSIFLNYNEENMLIDCGEGTQRQIRKAGLNPCKITRILITHWHGDHVLGIPGILQTLSLTGYNKTLFIYGPKGTNEFMKNLFKTFVFTKNYPIEIKEVEGKFFETNDFYLEAELMSHNISCNAYVFVKKGKIKIDKKKLKKSGLPHGPVLKKIKEGEDVIYNKKKYSAKNLIFKENDEKISFIFDTSMNKKIVSFVKNSDLLICESTFALDIKSKSKKLILTHLSQRYEKNPGKILDEAQKIFKKSFLVNDLDVIEI